jgi:uncharacterized protein (DUF2141 family)
MKNLLLLPLILLFFSSFSNPSGFSLTVKVTNIKSSKGVIEVGLYKDPEKFPKVGQTYKKIRVKPKSDLTFTYTFENLPQGKYAFALYHDVNANAECDRNFLGIPTEAYGFSNNIVPKFSAPSFSECATYLDKNKVQSVKLIH